MSRSRFVKIHQELDTMRQQGLFAGIVGSENDRGRIQTCIGEIGDTITDIQLDLLVVIRSRTQEIYTGVKVSILRPFVRFRTLNDDYY